MSTIATPSTPGVERKPLLIALAALGVVAVTAAVLPLVHTSTTASTASNVVVPRGATPDFLSRHDAMVVGAAAAKAAAAQRTLDQQAKVVAGTHASTITVQAAPAHLQELTSLEQQSLAARTTLTMREQVPGYQGTYQYTPTRSAGVGSTLEAEQIGGQHATYAYNGSSLEQTTPGVGYDGTGLRLRWSNNWIPPVDDPTWAPFISRHYFGPFPAERIVTRGD